MRAGCDINGMFMALKTSNSTLSTPPLSTPRRPRCRVTA